MNIEAKAERFFLFFFFFRFRFSFFLFGLSHLHTSQTSSAILTELTFLASVDKVEDNAGELLQHATCNMQREGGTWKIIFH